MAKKKRVRKAIKFFSDQKSFLLLLLLVALIVILFVIQDLWLQVIWPW